MSRSFPTPKRDLEIPPRARGSWGEMEEERVKSDGCEVLWDDTPRVDGLDGKGNKGEGEIGG